MMITIIIKTRVMMIMDICIVHVISLIVILLLIVADIMIMVMVFENYEDNNKIKLLINHIFKSKFKFISESYFRTFHALLQAHGDFPNSCPAHPF